MQLVYNANQLTGFYIHVFTEKYFQTDYNEMFKKYSDLFWNFISTHVALIFISKKETLWNSVCLL